jgi:hypothetical protein
MLGLYEQSPPAWANSMHLHIKSVLVLFLILLGAMTGYWGYRPLEDFTRVHRQSLIELLNLVDLNRRLPDRGFQVLRRRFQ